MVVLVALTIACAVIFSILKMRNETPERHVKVYYDIDTLTNRVKYRLAEICKESDDMYALDDDEYDALYERRSKVLSAQRNCVYGIDSAKIIVQELIREELMLALPEEEDALSVINFRDRFLSPKLKFLVMMYYGKKEHGKDALVKWILEHEFNKPRYVIEDKSAPSYLIDDEDIETVYRKTHYNFTYDNIIDLLTLLVFQRYKGFGDIDIIREMNINGINVGVSGSVLKSVYSGKPVYENPDDYLDWTRSVWVQVAGRYIHFRFIDLEEPDEVKRITNLIIRYNSPGSLTEKKGFIVNTMYDQSRVLAMRPPMGENYAFFLRKFSLSNNSLKFLLNPMKTVKGKDGAEVLIPLHHNTQLPIKMGEFLMSAKVSTAVTGRQSSGKTTTMKALVKFIDPMLNIRVLEMAPEMYLRELFPGRNIFSAQETDFITTTMIQDAFKKSDGAVTIVGEVATAEMAARLIESAKVASEFALFSHHAKETVDLVDMLAQNVVTVSPGLSISIARKLVIEAIMIDYHQDFDTTGERFMDRVTEIIPLASTVQYPEIDEDNVFLSYVKISREYYSRVTDRQEFTTRDLINFEHVERRYVANKMPSARFIEHAMSHLPENKIDDFAKFIRDNWVV